MSSKIVFLSFFLAVSAASSALATQPPNVLFIALDDLRLQSPVFGQNQTKTPGLDRLASEAVVFSRAYCSVPVCGASRASLMAGVRPTAERFRTYFTRKDEDFPDSPSIAKWFKEHGYTTVSNGKIYHFADDDIEAWSEKPWDRPNMGPRVPSLSRG